MPRPHDMPTAERWPHGVRARYVCGCRCDECRRANREYSRRRAKHIVFHGRDHLVDAAPIRAHLRFLAQRGVGKRAVHDASDVALTTIDEVRRGAQLQIRRSTAEKLLAIGVDAAADRALIPARETWRQINTLLAEGFTKCALAQRLGWSRAIQLNKRRVTAANAARVDRLYRTIMRGGEEVPDGSL